MMDTALIERLWAKALAEGKGVSGVGQRMAQLVAEECARIADTRGREHPRWSEGIGEVTDAIRERFGLLP